MAAKKQLTNVQSAEYAKGTKKQKARSPPGLEAVGMGRSTARRLLTQAVAATPREPAKRAGGQGTADAQMPLERLWLLMGMPCGPYMKAMFAQWIPALQVNGELDRDNDDDAVFGAGGRSMSPPRSTADCAQTQGRGGGAEGHVPDQARRPSMCATSIRIRKCTDEITRLPGLAETDTVAPLRGRSARGEFAWAP